MKTHNPQLNTARATGNSGCDYLTTGTLVYATQWPLNTSKGWYAFVVQEAATVTAVVFKNKSDETLTPGQTTTWLNVELPAGSYIPAGFIGKSDAYISSITLSGGKILLYLD